MYHYINAYYLFIMFIYYVYFFPKTENEKFHRKHEYKIISLTNETLILVPILLYNNQSTVISCKEFSEF